MRTLFENPNAIYREPIEEKIDLYERELERLRRRVRVIEMHSYNEDYAERALAGLPVHLTIQQVCDYLGISVPTFYRHLKNRILFPMMHIGTRPYYLLSDVESLMNRVGARAKGDWTYARLREDFYIDAGLEAA